MAPSTGTDKNLRIIYFLILAILTLILACLVWRQSEKAASGDNTKDHAAFYWGKGKKAVAVMDYWRSDDNRKVAVKRIAVLEFLFISSYLLLLCSAIYYYKRQEKRKWIYVLLVIGFYTAIVAAFLDLFQAYTMLRYIGNNDPVKSMFLLSWVKRVLLVMAILPLIVAMIPRLSRKSILQNISQLLKSLWLFFPGILFLVLPIFCFWILGQGKDFITAFIDNEATGTDLITFNYYRIFFFVAIIFWVYVSWYSSRIIAYVKQKRQEDDMIAVSQMTQEKVKEVYKSNDASFNIGKNYLEEFPRVLGNSCFLVLELAILQTPEFGALLTREAIIFFFVGLVIIHFINKLMKGLSAHKDFVSHFHWLLFFAIVVLVAPAFFKNLHIVILFACVVFLHAFFIYYINSRRQFIRDQIPTVRQEVKEEIKRTPFEKVMDYFCIPRVETGFYKWFLITAAGGIIVYFMCIQSLDFARIIGPFSFMILAFGVLLAFGNVVTAFSVKYKISFHFILLVLAFVFGLRETHYVRKIELGENHTNNYANRPSLYNYLNTWLKERNISAADSVKGYDMYFIMANGGASRSGYWTAAVLGQIEDSSIVFNPADRFSNHVFCLSGTSGGGVGVATFFSLLRKKEEHKQPRYDSISREFLKKDFFTYTVARMLGPDFFNYITHFSSTFDRAAALEYSFEKSKVAENAYFRVPFGDTLSEFPALVKGTVFLPILFINTTRMQDGNPAVVTNLKLDPAIFNNRVDVLGLLDTNQDISIATGAILGARFPYLSPAGNIKDNYFVDGGYFDNSGAGVVQEMIRGILNIAKDSPTLAPLISKINFKVLHIVNSPGGFDSSRIRKVSPIKNDLSAPILTILGAYDMQTTVNDARLKDYINDIRRDSHKNSEYKQISLYLDSAEWKKDPLYTSYGKERAYAMNWFMSDKTRNRINERLLTNDTLQMIIKKMRER